MNSDDLNALRALANMRRELIALDLKRRELERTAEALTKSRCALEKKTLDALRVGQSELEAMLRVMAGVMEAEKDSGPQESVCGRDVCDDPRQPGHTIANYH